MRRLAADAKRNHQLTVHEVYLFAELDPEGRFLRVEETTLMLSGAESDHALGNAR